MGMYGWHDNELEAYNIVVENDLTVKGTISFGDEAADKLIIQGRVSSMTAAGAAIQITSSYSYGEGIEMRYQVTDWTGVGSSFKGMYLRSEAITTAAGGKSIYGAEIYGVCNNVTMTTGSLWGSMNYAYVKGVDAVTINNMYAVQGELSWDASRTGDCTITTAAACFRAKITGGQVADYTKIHGYELTIGEMDGDSAKFGKGLFMQDDSGMSGTCTLTTGIDIAIGCTTGISIGGACSTAGIFLGTTNKISFHDSGIYMRASADGHFEIVADDTITLSVPGSGHGGIVFGGETDWGTGATGPDLDGTGWDWVTQTVGRVNTENITAAAYAGQYTALTVTKGQNLTSSFFANWNELYISASSVMTGASNFASIWAQVELGATVTSTDSGDFMAAVYGNFKTGATFTNNTKVCGFLAQSEVATSGLTNNGTISAFYAMKKSGCQVWDHGLYIADDSATTGITIGNCATAGITITGTAATAQINIAGTAILTSGEQAIYVNCPAETVATNGVWVTLKSTVASGDLTGVRAISESLKTSSGGPNVRAVYGQARCKTASKYAALLQGGLFVADVNGGSATVTNMYGVTGFISQGSGLTVSGNVAAVQAHLQTRSDESIGVHCGVLIHNEAVGGNGLCLAQGAIYITESSLGGSVVGYECLIDASTATLTEQTGNIVELIKFKDDTGTVRKVIFDSDNNTVLAVTT